MAESIIRGLVNRTMRRVKSGETLEMAKDAGIPAVMGLGLGYLGAEGKLDKKGIPLDAVAGGIAMGVSIFTPLGAEHRERIRQTAGEAIAVGMSRVGERLATKKGASHHGEFDGNSGFGSDPLVNAASRL